MPNFSSSKNSTGRRSFDEQRACSTICGNLGLYIRSTIGTWSLLNCKRHIFFKMVNIMLHQWTLDHPPSMQAFVFMIKLFKLIRFQLIHYRIIKEWIQIKVLLPYNLYWNRRYHCWWVNQSFEFSKVLKLLCSAPEIDMLVEGDEAWYRQYIYSVHNQPLLDSSSMVLIIGVQT